MQDYVSHPSPNLSETTHAGVVDWDADRSPQVW